VPLTLSLINYHAPAIAAGLLWISVIGAPAASSSLHTGKSRPDETIATAT